MSPSILIDGEGVPIYGIDTPTMLKRVPPGPVTPDAQRMDLLIALTMISFVKISVEPSPTSVAPEPN